MDQLETETLTKNCRLEARTTKESRINTIKAIQYIQLWCRLPACIRKTQKEECFRWFFTNSAVPMLVTLVFDYAIIIVMSKIDSIENDIRSLSPDELAALRRWFVEYDSDAWDREIEGNIAEGLSQKKS